MICVAGVEYSDDWHQFLEPQRDACVDDANGIFIEDPQAWQVQHSHTSFTLPSIVEVTTQAWYDSQIAGGALHPSVQPLAIDPTLNPEWQRWLLLRLE